MNREEEEYQIQTGNGEEKKHQVQTMKGKQKEGRIRGLELAREYYLQVGKPMLEEKFPEYLPRIAAGLVGEGSECMGFDDEISRDHDFGPSFCLWLTAEDYAEVGARMQEAYAQLPGEFLGFPARNISARGGGRVGVLEIRQFYGRYIGAEQPPGSCERWMYLPEDKLAAVTSGEVFEDPLGEFSRIRQALAAYYPEPVRIRKIAERAAGMAQSGQYNYGRCMRRGDVGAAALALDEFIRQTISMLYLLNRTYMPYYKWIFRGLQALPVLPEIRPLLVRLVRSNPLRAENAWEEPVYNPYVNREDERVDLIENICARVLEELKRQKLTSREEDFLEAHVDEIMARACDHVESQ